MSELTFDEFKDLRSKGLSIDQITRFEEGEVPSDTPKSKTSLREGTLLESKAYTEGIAPWLHGGSTFALGTPKMIAETQGSGMREAVFPEQTTIPGKINRGIAETLGFTVGMPLRLGSAVAKGAAELGVKAFPKLAGATGKLATAGQAGRLATEGGVAGLALEPENEQNRLEQAITFAAFGGGIPVAVAGVKGVGGYVGQNFKAVAKNIGGIADSTLHTVKRLGAERVFEPAKASSDYISANLLPRIRTKLNSAYEQFTPEVQTLLKDSYGVPLDAVNKIKKLGVNTVSQIRQKYNDSTDFFSTSIKEAIESKKAKADKMYADAVDSMKGDTVYLNSMMRTLRSKLTASKYIDFQGNPTTAYKSGLDPQLDALTTLYIELKPQGAVKGSIISKEQFSLYRDMLGRMLKERPSDRFVMSVRNALHEDAERSGMSGLRAARNEERKAFSVINQYLTPDGNLRALGKEKSLDRLYSLPMEQRRQLKDLEKVTGLKFYDELEALVSARNLDKLSKITDENIVSDLISAKDANRTNMVKEKYRKILGKEFDDEYDDLMAHFANGDFRIVSPTPGAGGGMFPSRSGIIRGATSEAVKTYLKDVRPELNRLRRFIGEGSEKLKGAIINERNKPNYGIKGLNTKDVSNPIYDEAKKSIKSQGTR